MYFLVTCATRLPLKSVNVVPAADEVSIVEWALDFYFDHTDSIIAQQISRNVEDGTDKTHDAKEILTQMGLLDV